MTSRLSRQRTPQVLFTRRLSPELHWNYMRLTNPVENELETTTRKHIRCFIHYCDSHH